MLEFLLTVSTLIGQVDISDTQTKYQFLNESDNEIITIVVDNYIP